MNIKIDSLGKKIGLGYALLTLILLISVLLTISQIKEVNSISERLIKLRQPSSRADIELLNGINKSIADLRGWILLKRDTFKIGRKKAWKEEINKSIATLDKLSMNWTNPENVERLSVLKPLISELNDYQEKVEEMAVSNVEGAILLMDEKVLPINKDIREIVQELVDDHERLTTYDFTNISDEITLLNMLEWILLVSGLLISALLAFLITRSITKPIGEVVEVAQNIGYGNLETEINVGGSKELDILGKALKEMRDSLKQKTQQTQHYEWVSTGLNKLNDAMRGDKDVEVLANDTIAFLSEYTESNIGSMYLMNDEKSILQLTGQYAYTHEQGVSQFRSGEGIVGQVAVNRSPLELYEIDKKNIKIRSSIVDVPPKFIYAIPFLFEGNTMGVIELGKALPFTDMQKELLKNSMESIGITINSAIASRKIKELLEETQTQSEELQQQQEELKQSNEELEEQTQKLKEQQEELQASNEELEEQTQVIEQKNRDLETARTDIELKAQQLEISSKYKSEFLANMSHELRTPLNSLLILSGELAKNKKGNLTDFQIEDAKVISKSGYDLLNLINEILDLSKIEAGKMGLTIKEIKIKNIVGSLLDSFNPLAKKKGIKLITNIDKSAPETINTDIQRLEQILKNLISNALKFTEKGNVTINLTKQATGHLSISVSDTGIGISQKDQKIVFEAFQQAEGGTSRKYGGTGLGLSISRELAKLLGGKIKLESEVGKGSTFTLIIPLSIHKNEVELSETTHTENKVDISINENSGMDTKYINYPTIEDCRDDIKVEDHSILIIEDDKEFAKLLAKQAGSKGFKYLSAATGEDGLLLAQRYQPNAIILDIDLPGINGHLVLKELKGNPDLRHIPVHVMSVNEKTLDTIKSGAVEYLTKPVSGQQLNTAFARIEDFVSRKMKNLLVIEDDDNLRRSIIKLIGNGDVQCIEAATGEAAISQLEKNTIDCIVLDIGLPDINGFDLIKKIQKKNGSYIPPIIVYTGKELSKKENDELQEYAETIIVKGVKSEERLLDETALFLHRTVKNLPQQKQEIITSLYDQEAVFKNKKVLLVDDDMRNVFAISRVLREAGFNIVKADNGIVALDQLKKEKQIDIVLMDIMMPEMDGYECMHEIRKQKQFKDLPIIALTAKAMKEDRQKCIDAGANDYITKPVNIERLLSLMRVWISK